MRWSFANFKIHFSFFFFANFLKFNSLREWLCSMSVWSLHSSLPQEEQVLPFPQNEGTMIPPSQKSHQQVPVKNSQKRSTSTYLKWNFWWPIQYFTSTDVISCWLKWTSLTGGMFPFKTWWHSSWKHFRINRINIRLHTLWKQHLNEVNTKKMYIK